MSDIDLDAVREDCQERSDHELTATVAALERAGATVATSAVIKGPPADELAAKVDRGRRTRGDRADPPARRGRVLPPRLDLAGPPQARRAGAAPARAPELRRAGRGSPRASPAPDAVPTRILRVKFAGARPRGRVRSDDPPPPTPGGVRPQRSPACSTDARCGWRSRPAPGRSPCATSRSGEVLALPDDAIDDQPGYTAAHLDLGGLPATPASAYDVVLVPGGGRAALPVWTPPLPPAAGPPSAAHRGAAAPHRRGHAAAAHRRRRRPLRSSASRRRDGVQLATSRGGGSRSSTDAGERRGLARRRRRPSRRTAAPPQLTRVVAGRAARAPPRQRPGRPRPRRSAARAVRRRRREDRAAAAALVGPRAAAGPGRRAGGRQ